MNPMASTTTAKKSSVDGEATTPQNKTTNKRAPQSSKKNKPPSPFWRGVKAYQTTFLVVSSYLLFRFTSKFMKSEKKARKLTALHLRNASRVETSILKLQGLFIKIGQFISILSNFLPLEFRKELEGLQDQVPPRQFKDIENRILEEFDGRFIDELFKRFDKTPLASASIGQVHKAKLHDGRDVAVKIQYPEIEKTVVADLKILSRIFKIIEFFTKHQGLDDAFKEIQLLVLDELDFRKEAKNTKLAKELFLDAPNVKVPNIVDSLSSPRVLTTEFETGFKITDLSKLHAAGLDRHKVAESVVEAYCKQIFSEGIYHADPHPGNLLVRPKANGEFEIVFLDFGAVAEISEDMRQGIIDLIRGALGNDSNKISNALKKMGFVARGANEAMFEQVVEHLHRHFQKQISVKSLSLKDIKFDPAKGLERLADIRKMNISIRELSKNLHVPREWIILERTLLLLMGLCTELSPQLNPMVVIRPYLQRFVLGEDGDWSKLAVDTAKDVALNTMALPGDLRKFMRQAKNGEFQLTFKNLDQNIRRVERLGHQGMAVLVGIASTAFALYFENHSQFFRSDLCWWLVKASALYALVSIVRHSLFSKDQK